jgi:hypothetical protein
MLPAGSDTGGGAGGRTGIDAVAATIGLGAAGGGGGACGEGAGGDRAGLACGAGGTVSTFLQKPQPTCRPAQSAITSSTLPHCGLAQRT